MKLVIAPFLSVMLTLATAETTQAQTTCKYPWSTYPTAGYCGGTAQIFRPQLRRAWLAADLSSSNVATRAAAVGWLIAEDSRLDAYRYPVSCAGYMDRL